MCAIGFPFLRVLWSALTGGPVRDTVTWGIDSRDKEKLSGAKPSPTGAKMGLNGAAPARQQSGAKFGQPGGSVATVAEEGDVELFAQQAVNGLAY